MEKKNIIDYLNKLTFECLICKDEIDITEDNIDVCPHTNKITVSVFCGGCSDVNDQNEANKESIISSCKTQIEKIQKQYEFMYNL